MNPPMNVVPLRRPVGEDTVQGALALDLTPRLAPPAPGVRDVPTAIDLVVADRVARQRLDAFVRRHLQAVVEIAMADRPVSQVLRHCSPDVYADLASIPKDAGVDMVDIFRRSEAVPAVVEEALRELPELRTIWMQLGVQHDGAAAVARAAGKTVVQNRCPKIDFPRFL